MDREPARSGQRFDQLVLHVRTEQYPIARNKIEAFGAHLKDGSAVKDDHPLLMSLVIVDGRRKCAAQNVLYHNITELNDLLIPFTDGGRVHRGTEPAADDRGHEGSSLPSRSDATRSHNRSWCPQVEVCIVVSSFHGWGKGNQSALRPVNRRPWCTTWR